MKNKIINDSDYFLSKRRLLTGILFTFLENTFKKAKQVDHFNYKNAKVIRRIKSYPSNWNNSTNIIFQVKDGEKVLVKNLHYRFKNLAYRQLLNEAGMFKLLNKVKLKKCGPYSFQFPKIYEILVCENNIIFARQYQTGNKLSEHSKHDKVKLINQLLIFFCKLYDDINIECIKHLPKRGYLYVVLTFPYYVASALLKNLKQRELIWSLSKIFIKNLGNLELFNRKLLLAHRDLHSKNIIIQNNNVFIIDPEISVLAEELTDLAITARAYFDELGPDHISKLLSLRIKNKKQLENFTRLTTYYTTQILATYEPNSSDYITATKYAKFILKLNTNQS